MKTIYIPKGETIRYESLATEHLVVHGCLQVTCGITAKTITGYGTVHAGTVNADVIRVDDMDAGSIVCKRLLAKRVQSPEVFASESAAVSCFLSSAYDEMARDERGDTVQQQKELRALREKIVRRQSEQYQSKFTEPLAEIAAKVNDLGTRYKRESVAYKAFHAGMDCPTCHRRVTEETLPEVQAALKKNISELYAAGTEQKGQLTELQEMDKKARDTFDAFKEADLRKWTEDAAELERRCAEQSETSSQAAESLRSEIQALTAELEYGNLTQAEYGRLRECREQCRELESKLSALNEMASAQTPDFDREIREAQEAIGKIKRTMTNVISYVSKRAELTFSQLKMNRVEISLYDVVKSTGEVKDTFKFTYSGRRYDRLSLSEKIRAGMELSELIKRLTGRNYPVFVDNMESVDDLANVRPTGQIIMAKCVSNAPLQVRPIKPIVFAEQRAA